VVTLGTLPRAHRALLGPVLAALLVLGLDTTASGAEPTGSVSGIVTGGGTTLANVWVSLSPVDSRGTLSGPVQRTATDASGRYEFPGLAAGPVKVQVKAPLLGELVDTYWPAAHTFDAAGAIDVTAGRSTADVDLPLGGSVRGQVVDARTGAPIDGARVSASIADASSSGSSLGAAPPSSAPGLFSLTGLPPVAIELSVSLPPGSRYLTPAQDPSGPAGALRIDGGARTTGVTIGLRAAAEIAGTVRDDAGTPVTGADVRLTGCLPACPPHATTDAAGRYRLAGVAPSTDLAVVAQPAWGLLGPWYPSREVTARVPDLEVGEGDVVDSVDLTLTRPAFVTLDVIGADLADPVRAIVQLTTTGRTHSQYFAGRAIIVPGSPSESGELADPATGPPPADSIRLNVGPVPPGEYSVGIRLGVADAGYLPTRWVTDSGIPSGPTIRLAPGEENNTVVWLAPSGAVTGADVAAPDPEPPGGWPGLGQGFLAPGGWTDPLR
jgi:hypothetical protein